MAAVAFLLVAGMCGIAAADGQSWNNGEDAQTVDAVYNVLEYYVITIPSEVAVSTTENQYAVSASNVAIASEKELVVSLQTSHYSTTDTSDHVELTENSKTSSIPYTIKFGGVSPGTTAKSGTDATPILTVAAGTASGSVNLYVKTTIEDIHKATLVGDHKDTWTFNVAVNAPSTP